MIRRNHFPAVAYTLLALAADAQAAPVEISTDHPGGNVILVNNDTPDSVTLKPDLRGGRDWFYWNFEATSMEPGDIEFVFEGKLRIGVRGPAYSTDRGKTWSWLGTDDVRFFDAATDDVKSASESFRYTFAEKGESVRFAVVIPYQKADLDAFVSRHSGNPHFTRSELTQSRGGRPVDLLRIGSGDKAVIITARHHACESMASYVMEGFLEEALSESNAAKAFRKRHTLHAIPMMDSDGVEAGDQGKWRFPHDHNRDYGEGAIYPEVQAVMKLGDAIKPAIALDFHCPSLKGDTHEVFYFIGVGLPHIHNNTEELIGWIGEECPQIFPRGPHNFLRDPPATVPEVIKDTKFSVWFSFLKGVDFAATFEIPYSQASFDFTPDMARAYGRAMLRAWMRTEFISDPEKERDVSYNQFSGFRKKFMAEYKSKPTGVEEMLANPVEHAPYPAEKAAISGLAALRHRDYVKATSLFRSVIENDDATAHQRLLATAQNAIATIKNPDSTAEEISAAVRAVEEFPYPSHASLFEVFGTLADYHASRDELKPAIEYTRRQLPHSSAVQRGATLNRLADLLSQTGNDDAAENIRNDAVSHLRSQTEPTIPVGIFGALMAKDLFDALSKLPNTSREDLEAAAESVLEHKIASKAIKEEVQATLDDWKKDGN